LAGASLGDESFSCLDYADDVVVLAEMLEVQIMNPDRIHETKKISADDEKQSEKRKR